MSLLAIVGTATCWTAVVLTWVTGALYNASRGPAERAGAPSGSVALVGAVIVLAIIALLTLKIVPSADWHSLAVQTLWVRIFGLMVLLGSTVFTLWARFALGTMWSSHPTIKEQHALRTDGPYGITRHPIYTGLLGMLAGTWLLAGIGHWILLFPVGLILFEIRISAEERMLLTTFPDGCPRYREQVPQLVPGLRLIRRFGRASGPD
jgi:protein-S-isoprenylcysteine O-methyltransferase Ste14